jgi:hypothetical protein
MILEERYIDVMRWDIDMISSRYDDGRVHTVISYS